MEEYRVIIAGGRDFKDYDTLLNTVDSLLENIDKKIVIVSGGARGADSLGEQYAVDHGYKIKEFPARWDQYGKSAGFRRNVQMAENADCLIAFWDGQSHGTEHMIKTGKEHNLDVHVIPY